MPVLSGPEGPDLASINKQGAMEPHVATAFAVGRASNNRTPALLLRC